MKSAEGSIKWQLLLNAVSVLTRQGAGVLVFVLLARQLGPAPFGEFMYAFSMASLAAFASALGFNQSVMREIAANPHEVQQIIGVTTRTRLSLTGIVFLVLAVLAWALGDAWTLIAVLAVATISDTFVEYMFCISRAKGAYGREAGFMTGLSVLHMALVTGVLLADTPLIGVAAAFSASKILQMLAVYLSFKATFGAFSIQATWREQWQHVRQSAAYATDVGLQILSSQLDTVVIRHVLGAHAAGVYQSGMRLVAGMQNFSVIASNVLLPRLAAVHRQPDAFRNLARRADLMMALLGIVSAAALYVLGRILLSHGYGAEFTELGHLLPWFALLIGLRIFAASSGIQLTALGDQKFRTRTNVCAVIVLLGSLWGLSEHFGLLGATQALFLPLALVMLAYQWRLLRHLKVQEKK